MEFRSFQIISEFYQLLYSSRQEYRIAVITALASGFACIVPMRSSQVGDNFLYAPVPAPAPAHAPAPAPYGA